MSELALFGGDKVRTDPWPGWPIHDERDVAAVAAVVRSGNWGGFPYPGPQTQRFLDSFIEAAAWSLRRRCDERNYHHGSGAARGRHRLAR